MSQPANDEFSQHLSDDEESNHEDASDTGDAPKQQQQVIPQTTAISNIKLPILKKEEYDIWAMEMEHYLEYIDNEVWKVIQNGNSKKRISTRKDGIVRILSPVTAAEIQAVEKERKAKNILLMAIPKEHMRRFHGMDDAKEIWEAIRTRFGGNANSKKMQKAVFKQQFEAFKISSSEGLEKGYDRFQQLLSQLEAHGAEVSTEDANHKFLRSLPAAWSNLAMTMRTKPEIDTLSIDDLYNNLRVFEQEIQGASKTSSSAQNVAFVSQSKSSTNKVKSGLTGAYSTCTPSTSSTNIPKKEVLAGFADEVIYSLFAKQSEDWDLLHEDLEQIDDVDIEEMDINWQIAMIAIRMKKFYKKTGRRVRVDGKTPVGFDKKKLECFNCHNTGHFARECTAKGTHDGKKKRDSFYQHQEAGKQEKNQMGLLTMDDGIVNWGEHTEVEETNHALMAISSSNEVTLCSKTCIDSYNTLKLLCDEQMNQLGDQEAQILAYSQAVKKLEAQLVTFQKQQLSLNEKLTFQANEIYEKDEKLKRYRRIGMKAVKEKEQLQKTLDSWKDSSKNLWRLINSGMSSNSKVGLGFEIQSNNEVLSYEEEMNFSVFNCSKEDSIGKPLYSRFTKTNDFKGVPHPLSGDYTPKPQEEIDDSLYVYGKKGPQKPEISDSDDNSTEHSTCQSNDSEGSCGNTSEHSFESESESISVPNEMSTSRSIVQLNAGRPNINSVRPRVNAVSSNVNTVRSRQPVPTKNSNSLSPKRPQMNQINQRRDFSKSHSYVRRPFAKTTAQMSHSNAVKGNWGSAVKTSASYHWRNSRPNSNCDSGPTFIRTVNAKGTSTEEHVAHRKSDEGFLVGYSLNSKAYRVYNLVTKRVEVNLHVNFLEDKPNVKGVGYRWMFDIHYLTNSMNYIPVSFENQANPHAGTSEVTNNADTSQITNSIASEEKDKEVELIVVPSAVKITEEKVESRTSSTNSKKEETLTEPQIEKKDSSTDTLEDNPKIQAFRRELEEIALKHLGTVPENNSISTSSVNTGSQTVNTGRLDPDDSPMPELEIFHKSETGIFDEASYDEEGVITDFNSLPTEIEVSPTPTLRIHNIHPKSQILGDPKSAVQTRSKVQQKSRAHALLSYIQKQQRNNHKDQHHCLFACFLSQEEPKKITEALQDDRKRHGGRRLVAQGYTQEEGIDYDEVFAPVARIEAISFGMALHQVPRAWYATLSTFLEKHGYKRGTIDKTLFIKRDKLMISFLVLPTSLGVAEILKKFDLVNVKAAITPMETKVALTKDEEAIDVDVHLYRSMIGSLMYLTASRPDIMYAVCVCSRFQVTPKISHLNAVKRIFKYLKGKPNLGLWYPRESPFDLEAFSDSDYGGSNLDRKSTTGGCQFLGQRLISWQCKKQTIVATSTTEAEYVAAANCCGQVLWVQNQLLDYGFNFMNTKIHIDNESTICIVKNLVYHSKTKHIEIRHHFIRDCYEKKLISVEKIHTNLNVADLLTKPFDGPRFNYLVVSIGIAWTPDESAGFAEIVDFLRGSNLRYTITEASISKIKASISSATGLQCSQMIEILRMGKWGNPTEELSPFGKAFHTPIVYNFSKLIFDGMVANLKSKTKFLMYPRFLQLILDIQTENKHPYLAVTLTKKIFGNMKRGFRGAPRPLLPAMLLVATTNPNAGQEHHAVAQSQPSSSTLPAPSTSPPPIQSLPPTSIPTPTPIPASIPTPTPIPASIPTPTPIPASIPTPTPIPASIPTPTPIPASIPTPTPIPETEPEPFEHTFEEPSPVHQHFSPPQEQAQGQMTVDDLLQVVPQLISRIDSLETDLKHTKLTMGNAIVKLVKKVKKLEGFLKRRNVVLSDSKEEEPEAQGRKSQDDPLVSLVQGLVTPSMTTVNASGEEQVEDISPNTLEAAKTLSRVASLKPKSIDKGRRYKRRKETKGKKVVSSLDFQEEIDTGAKEVNTAEGVNTSSIKISTVSEQVSTGSAKRSIPSPDKGQRAGKAPMIIEETPKNSKEQILQEEASLAEAIGLDTLQKEEVANQVHLDSLLAQRVAEEEELNEQQKKRRAQVQFEAQRYTDEDWDLIRANIEANAELQRRWLI
ncbi:putative ribonuclease H-like domain-containing protein [Tanacetum coccineum]